MNQRLRIRTLFVCVFVSGGAALVYEVVWARQLTLFLGITTYAHAAVLTAFMLGLAVGSVVLGQVSDRIERPTRLYGLLEIGIGLYAAGTPWLVVGLQSTYVAVMSDVVTDGAWGHFLRFTLALAALLVPTFLMGGTLPVLVKGCEPALSVRTTAVAKLYGVNTLGAASGALVAGYLLLPTLGISRTLWLGALLNLAVGLVVLGLGPLAPAARKKRRPRPTPEVEGNPGRSLWLLLTAFAISGFAALLLQIAWVRTLVLIIGSSVYAFSVTLATYLLGLGLGSLFWLRSARASAPFAQRARIAACLEAAVVASVLAGLLWIDRLPGLFVAGHRVGLTSTFLASQILTVLISASLMLLPTLLLGALFPLLTGLWAGSSPRLGRRVGTAYGANTVGTVLGALTGGVLLLPALGLQSSLVLGAGLNLVAGGLLWLLAAAGRSWSRRAWPPALAALVFGLVVAVLPPWNQKLMSSGPHSYAARLDSANPEATLEQALASRNVLFYEEGAEATVAVTGHLDGHRFLLINGKTDASTRGDMPTQTLLAQLPLLFHPEPRSALIVGLGSGITAGAALSHASLESLDILEISPQVVEATRFFLAENGRPLEDPRVHLRLVDARSHLLMEPRRFDVIISEPSNPWITGVANMFTRELFELARSRLESGGIMAQWIHFYKLPNAELKSLLATFLEVFPETSVWTPGGGDLILLGSEAPHTLDYGRLRRLLEEAPIRASLSRIDSTSPHALVDRFLFSNEVLARYVEGAPLNTDDRPRLEFRAGRALFEETTRENTLDLLRYLHDRSLEVPMDGLVSAREWGFDADALGLTVRTPNPVAAADWEADWRLRREVGDDGELRISSQRSLTWQEGESRVRAVAAAVSTTPTLEGMASFLEAYGAGEAVERGAIQGPGDTVAGLFQLRHQPSGELLANLLFTCHDPGGGVVRVLVESTGPDADREGRLRRASDLSDRIGCQDARHDAEPTELAAGG